MMKRIKTLIIATLASMPLLLPTLAFTGVHAQDIGNVSCGVNGNLAGTDCDPDEGADETINGIIETIIRILQVVVGVVSVIMIIIGGFKYVTSGGESGGVTSAKNTILYAIIGLVIVILAEVIVQFALNRVAE